MNHADEYQINIKLYHGVRWCDGIIVTLPKDSMATVMCK